MLERDMLVFLSLQEKGLNETESTYTALNIQSQNSEYWTLKVSRCFVFFFFFIWFPGSVIL